MNLLRSLRESAEPIKVCLFCLLFVPCFPPDPHPLRLCQGICLTKGGEFVTFDDKALRIWNTLKQERSLHAKCEHRFIEMFPVDALDALLIVMVKSKKTGPVVLRLISHQLDTLQELELPIGATTKAIMSADQRSLLLRGISPFPAPAPRLLTLQQMKTTMYLSTSSRSSAAAPLRWTWRSPFSSSSRRSLRCPRSPPPSHQRY